MMTDTQADDGNRMRPVPGRAHGPTSGNPLPWLLQRLLEKQSESQTESESNDRPTDSPSDRTA